MWFDAPFDLYTKGHGCMGTQYWFGFAVVSVGLLLGTVLVIWVVW